METLVVWFFVVAFVLLVIWAADRALFVKEIEKDLKQWLGDAMVARDSAEASVRVHYIAQVAAIKTLIRKHFKL